MDNNLQQLQSSMQRVQNDIEETRRDVRHTETQITDNERAIQKLNSLLETPFDNWDPKDQRRYRNADHILEVELPYLRDKEKYLREEKKLLRKANESFEPCNKSFYDNISKGIERDGWISFDKDIVHPPL